MSLVANFARLNIHLDEANLYKSGDIVSGCVSLSSDEPNGQNLNIGSISIAFTGRVTTSKQIRDIQDQSRSLEVQNHRRFLQLFGFKTRLYSGPGHIFAPNKVDQRRKCPTFRFSFTFPSDCEHSQTEDLQGTPFFNANRRQPLPPSILDEGSPDRGCVAYELSAEILAPGSNGYYMEGSFMQKQALNLYTLRDVFEPTVIYSSQSKSFFHQSLDLLPPPEREIHMRPLTMSQKLKLRRHPTDHYPKAAFKTTFMMPSVAVIGQPLPIMLQVDHDLARSTVTTPPIIYLKHVQVWLRSETSICSMVHKALKLDDPEQTAWTSVATLAQRSFEGTTLPRVDRLDLRQVMDLRLSNAIPPSFKSFNIARTYSLRVGARIECAGKDFHLWGFDYVRCVLLAADFLSGLPSYTAPPSIGVVREDTSDDPPPPYERVPAVDQSVPQTTLEGPSLDTRREPSPTESRERSLTPSGRHANTPLPDIVRIECCRF